MPFFPSTLTESHLQDDKLPRPPLSQIEAEGIFKHLEDLKLVFPMEINGHTAYAINETKPHEWEAAISELRKPKWKRSKTLLAIGAFIVWILSLIISGFIGGVSRKAADDAYDARKAKISISDHVALKEAELQSKEANQQQSNPQSNAPRDEATK